MTRKEFNRKYTPDDLLELCDAMDNMPQKPFSDRAILREDSIADEVAEVFYNEKVMEFLSDYQDVLDGEKESQTKTVRFTGCKHLDFSDTHPEAEKCTLEDKSVHWHRPTGGPYPWMFQFCTHLGTIPAAETCLRGVSCQFYSPFEHEVEVEDKQ